MGRRARLERASVGPPAPDSRPCALLGAMGLGEAPALAVRPALDASRHARCACRRRRRRVDQRRADAPSRRWACARRRHGALRPPHRARHTADKQQTSNILPRACRVPLVLFARKADVAEYRGIDAGIRRTAAKFRPDHRQDAERASLRTWLCSSETSRRGTVKDVISRPWQHFFNQGQASVDCRMSSVMIRYCPILHSKRLRPQN